MTKHCSSCRHGEINCPADVKVSGKTPEGRPYRANVCLSHLDVLETTGYDVRVVDYFSDAPEVMAWKSDALWTRYEAARARYRSLPRNTADWLRAFNAAGKVHSQWLAATPGI